MPTRSRKHHKGLKKHRGGGQGAGFTPGGPLVGFPLNAQVNTKYDACLSATRPGQMDFVMSKGLPGMMKGGRYTNNLASNYAGFPQIDKIPCESPITNPMNPRIQAGGVGPQSASDMGVWEAHTARYTTAPSQWAGSTGAPVLLNQALDPKMWSRACTQTAGRRNNLQFLNADARLRIGQWQRF